MKPRRKICVYTVYTLKKELHNYMMNYLWFWQVVKVRPNDKDAKAKYTECNKIVKMNAFAKAIAVNDTKSVAETLDLENMSKWVFLCIEIYTYCVEMLGESILVSGHVIDDGKRYMLPLNVVLKFFCKFIVII